MVIGVFLLLIEEFFFNFFFYKYCRAAFNRGATVDYLELGDRVPQVAA